MKSASMYLIFFAMLLSGCGSQMMRQPSYQPLDIPRAAPSPDAVPAAIEITPTDGRPAVSRAFGASSNVGDEAVEEYTDNAQPETIRPPANLSDNARCQATPPNIDSIVSPVALTGDTLIKGRALFPNRCVQCHNASGYGYGPVGGYLVPHPQDLASQLVQKRCIGAIFWHITVGQGNMPAFKTWTSVAQRWQLSAYVRSLKGARTGVSRSDTASAPYPTYGEPGFENTIQWAQDIKTRGGYAP